MSKEDMLEFLCLSACLRDYKDVGLVNIYPNTFQVLLDRYIELTRKFINLYVNTQK